MARNFTTYLRDEKAGANISWAAVFAGVVTFFAVFLTLSLIGNAIGLALLSPASSDVINGAGTGVLVWTIVNFLLSFGAAGFIAGLTSGRVGLVHGFLTWATSLVLLVSLLSWGAVSALNTAGSMVGSVANVAGKGVSAVASGAGDLISSGSEQLVTSISDINTDKLGDDVTQILRDTDEPKLQPAYLQEQLDSALADVKDAAKQAVTNPEQADALLQQTADKLKARADEISDSVDRDAIARAVAKNTQLSEAEAKQATDNAYEAYQKSVQEVKQGIDTAATQMKELSASAKQAVADARHLADNATDAGAKYSLWGFFGLLLALAAASAAGLAGARVGSKPEVKANA